MSKPRRRMPRMPKARADRIDRRKRASPLSDEVKRALKTGERTDDLVIRALRVAPRRIKQLVTYLMEQEAARQRCKAAVAHRKVDVEWERDDARMAEAETTAEPRRLANLARDPSLVDAVAENPHAPPRLIKRLLRLRSRRVRLAIWGNPARHSWPEGLRIAVERAHESEDVRRRRRRTGR